MTELTKDMLKKAMDKFANNEVPEDAKVYELEQELKPCFRCGSHNCGWEVTVLDGQKHAGIVPECLIEETGYDLSETAQWRDKLEEKINTRPSPWRADFENMPRDGKSFLVEYETYAGKRLAYWTQDRLGQTGFIMQGVISASVKACTDPQEFVKKYKIKRYMLIPE